jgi:hypothetical protein
MRKDLSFLMLAGFIGLTAMAAPASAGSVENLERERAIMLEVMLQSDLTASERYEKITVSKRRLIDLERIVLRDKSLTGRKSPAVKRAFSNYDLTFLAHASTEKNLLVTDHWLEQLGLTSQNVMAASRRRR